MLFIIGFWMRDQLFRQRKEVETRKTGQRFYRCTLLTDIIANFCFRNKINSFNSLKFNLGFQKCSITNYELMRKAISKLFPHLFS